MDQIINKPSLYLRPKGLIMRFYALFTLVAVLWGCGSDKTTDGDRLYKNGEYTKAVEAFTAKLETKPSDITLLYNRGRAFEELGKLKEAEADFTKITEIDEKNVSAYLSLSQINYKQESFSKAVIFADKALEINENSAQGHFLVARAKHQLGYIDSALESYSLAINIDRSYGEAYLYRGALKIGKKQSRSACEDIAKAVNLNVPDARNIQNKYCK